MSGQTPSAMRAESDEYERVNDAGTQHQTDDRSVTTLSSRVMDRVYDDRRWDLGSGTSRRAAADGPRLGGTTADPQKRTLRRSEDGLSAGRGVVAVPASLCWPTRGRYELGGRASTVRRVMGPSHTDRETIAFPLRLDPPSRLDQGDSGGGDYSVSSLLSTALQWRVPGGHSGDGPVRDYW